MADFISFPFYDLLQENGHVPEIRTKLPPLLAGVRRSILEIGAGTGLITTSLADWTPAEIFALEPSAGMRRAAVAAELAPGAAEAGDRAPGRCAERGPGRAG
jgi:ubiquinone/menaquinone biosynthesis C-methylase UbiE